MMYILSHVIFFNISHIRFSEFPDFGHKKGISVGDFGMRGIRNYFLVIDCMLGNMVSSSSMARDGSRY